MDWFTKNADGLPTRREGDLTITVHGGGYQALTSSYTNGRLSRSSEDNMDRPICRTCGVNAVRRCGTTPAGRIRWRAACSGCERRKNDADAVEAERGRLLEQFDCASERMTAAHTAEVADLHARLSGLVAERDTLQELAERLDERLQATDERANDLSVETQVVERLARSTREQNAALQNELATQAADLRTWRDLADARQREVDALDSRMEGLKVDRAALESDLDKAQRREAGLRDKLVVSESRREEMGSRLSSASEEIRRISDVLDSRVRDLMEATDARDDLRQANEASEAMIQRLRHELERASDARTTLIRAMVARNAERAKLLGALVFGNNLIWLALWLLLR